MITHIERNTLLVQNTNGFTKNSNNQEQEIFFHSPAYFKASSYNRPRPHRNQSSHCPAGPGKRKAKAPGNGKAKVAEAKGKRAQAARPHEMPRGTPRPLFPWRARAFRTVHGRHRPLRDAPVAVAVAGAPGPCVHPAAPARTRSQWPVSPAAREDYGLFLICP